MYIKFQLSFFFNPRYVDVLQCKRLVLRWWISTQFPVWILYFFCCLLCAVKLNPCSLSFGFFAVTEWERFISLEIKEKVDCPIIYTNTIYFAIHLLGCFCLFLQNKLGRWWWPTNGTLSFHECKLRGGDTQRASNENNTKFKIKIESTVILWSCHWCKKVLPAR